MRFGGKSQGNKKKKSEVRSRLNFLFSIDYCCGIPAPTMLSAGQAGLLAGGSFMDIFGGFVGFCGVGMFFLGCKLLL